MMIPTNEERSHLLGTVRQLLWEDWDPIGVNHFPEAHDEYDSYAYDIVNMIERRVSRDELFEYLWELETGHMGLPGNKELTAAFANKLIQLQTF